MSEPEKPKKKSESAQQLAAAEEAAQARFEKAMTELREGRQLGLALLPVSLLLLCSALAVTETLVAKMRILLVPRLIGVGAAVALLGIVTWLVDAL